MATEGDEGHDRPWDIKLAVTYAITEANAKLCQSFYAICNRISLRRRAGASLCLRQSSSFSAISNNPPTPSALPHWFPIDSTCLRLKTSLSSLPAFSTFIRVLRLTLFLRVSLFPTSRSFPPSRRKVFRDFFHPLSFTRPLSSAFRPWYRSISASLYSVYDRFPRNGVIKPAVYR